MLRRFALLGSLCGTIIVLLVEIVAVFCDSASRAVERIIQARLPSEMPSTEEQS